MINEKIVRNLRGQKLPGFMLCKILFRRAEFRNLQNIFYEILSLGDLI